MLLRIAPELIFFVGGGRRFPKRRHTHMLLLHRPQAPCVCYWEPQWRPGVDRSEDSSLCSCEVTGEIGKIWPWVNTNGCTTHFRSYFSGDWDVHWGYEPWPYLWNIKLVNHAQIRNSQVMIQYRVPLECLCSSAGQCLI